MCRLNQIRRFSLETLWKTLNVRAWSGISLYFDIIVPNSTWSSISNGGIRNWGKFKKKSLLLTLEKFFKKLVGNRRWKFDRSICHCQYEQSIKTECSSLENVVRLIIDRTERISQRHVVAVPRTSEADHGSSFCSALGCRICIAAFCVAFSAFNSLIHIIVFVSILPDVDTKCILSLCKSKLIGRNAEIYKRQQSRKTAKCAISV